jgi:hypothetical protein
VADEIEERADRVLGGVPGWVWDGAALPVPVEDIVDTCFGLLVRDMVDLTTAPGVPALGAHQSLSGLLLPTRREIWVNAGEAREWPSRRRFTIGHELGHWCLHREGGSTIFCRETAIGGSETDGRPPPEEEANRFAAALLMPAGLVRRHYERERREEPSRCFERLCELFGASGAAMGRRLHRVVRST